MSFNIFKYKFVCNYLKLHYFFICILIKSKIPCYVLVLVLEMEAVGEENLYGEDVMVSLDDRELWLRFQALTNEMIVTKSGRQVLYFTYLLFFNLLFRQRKVYSLPTRTTSLKQLFKEKFQKHRSSETINAFPCFHHKIFLEKF